MIRALSLLAALVMFAGCQAAGTCPSCDTCEEASHVGHLRHVVLFKFKAGTSPAKIAEIEKAFAELPKKIPAIVDFEWGTNNSPEGQDQCYTHCFLVTFKDAKGREIYLPHPDHKKFVELAGPHFEAVHVVDYVAKK